MVTLVTPRDRKRSEYYSDFRKDLELNPINNDVAKKTDEEAIKESIKNLVLTDRGERLFQPDIGCDVRKQLFNNFTPQTIKSIENAIRNTINQYEPRCNLIGVDVIGNPDRNKVEITIMFNVINIPDEVVLTLVLDRVR